MADGTSREEQKRMIRERTASAEEIRSAPGYARQERERIRRRNMIIALSVLAALLLAAGAYLWLRFYRFSTYDVDAELKIGGLSKAVLHPYAGGCVAIGPDSLTYVKDDSVVWTGSVKLNDAVFAERDGFFAVCDRGGYQAYICDGTGILSTVRVSRHIRKLDISSEGVLCVFTEADDAAYISFFDRFGTKTQAEVKALLSATGYPMDIAVSPDGKKLITLYYSTENGIGESRLVCYDFETGRSGDNYIVASFDDYYDSDTLLIDAQFTGNDAAYVIGDHSVTFLTTEKKEIRRTVVETGDQVQSVFKTGDRVGLVVRKDGGNTCVLYDKGGKAGRSFEVQPEFDGIAANDRLIWFFRNTEVTIRNLTGELRYEGELADKPVSVCPGADRSLMINTGTELMHITYK